MVTKQISVFIENRKGRLGDVLDVLKGANVNICSVSLADTADYGILRIISDKPQEGRLALAEAGFSSSLSEVFILRLPNEPGGLFRVLRILSDEALSVEYLYGLTASGEEASIVVKISEPQRADEAFTRNGIQTLSYEGLGKEE